MSESVFIISEWLAKPGKDQELWQRAKKLIASVQKEEGCLRAHVVRQFVHPAAPGQSKYSIVSFQEYKNLDAFEAHCKSDYVAEFFNTYVQNEDSGIVEDWTCRLFNSDAE